MSGFSQMLNHPFVETLGWSLIHFLCASVVKETHLYEVDRGDNGSQTLFALLLATVCSMKRTPSRPS
jgi:hypothetical protein